MKQTIQTEVASTTLLAMFPLLPIHAQAAKHAIDVENSALTVRGYKSGLLSIFARDHESGTPVRSTAIEKTGLKRWFVRGDSEIHRQSRPAAIEVSEQNGRYQGVTTSRQRDFRIGRVSLIGETVKVNDQVKMESEVVPIPQALAEFV